MDSKSNIQDNASNSSVSQDIPNSVGEALQLAIGEMELLLSHATQAGELVPLDCIKAFVKAKREASSGTINDKTEIQFWHEFQRLGKQLQPISVDSLKATSEPNRTDQNDGFFGFGKQRSFATAAVRRYRIWSVVTLFLLLVTQIYTIFGFKTVNEIQSLYNDIKDEEIKISDLSRAAAEAKFDESRRLIIQLREADSRLSQMNDQLAPRWDMLMSWFPFKLKMFEPGGAQNPARLIIAQIILDFLSKYLLPLLYGLLGACVYVLRTLSEEIRNLLYTVDSNIRFQLRIYLGALAGLAIGWFITEQSAPTVLRSVTPVTLAFIAGYSVELLFKALDTIINAFIKEPRSKPRTVNEAPVT